MTAPELWWILSAMSVIFLIADWHQAPIDTTMHVGFLLIAAAMGPLGAIIYVLTVREPLPHTHAEYIAPLWKQVVGSTFHCVAGDSIGIVGAASFVGFIPLIGTSMILNLTVEYLAGFLVGWLIFQALFMKDMVGGSYLKAVRSMFVPEWLSMNGVMAGMIAVMVPWIRIDPAASYPSRPIFWFMMSMALIAGAGIAYPLNWMLVAGNLKHGIMTIERNHLKPGARDNTNRRGQDTMMAHHAMKSNQESVIPIALWSMGLLGTALALTLW